MSLDPLDPRFVMPSRYQRDEGLLIGRDPRSLPVEDLRALGHPDSPIRAIRAKCLDCAENAAEVRKCTATGCPLWPMRMGVNRLDPRSKGVALQEPIEDGEDGEDGDTTDFGWREP